MSRTRLSSLSLLALIAVAGGCGTEGADARGQARPRGRAGGPIGAAGRGPGAAGAGGAGGMKPMGMPKPMGPGKTGTGGAGSITIGIPQPGSPGTVFPGWGPDGQGAARGRLHAGERPRVPSSSGVCATSATSKPTNTTSGSICFYGDISGGTSTTTTSSTRAATIEYLSETAGGQSYYRFRITFDPAFVDNTYGANAIGWGTKGHTFKDLVGSYYAELSLFDGTPTLVSQFDIDYITANAASACAYGALGVSGGEGKMLLGDSKYVLASTTSLDRDLNGCGYCKSAACGGDCTVDSPVTDANYTPNSAAPNWDYRVVYEVWVDAAVFAGKGFGGASITFVHASPSKASSNTVTVIPKPCGGCPTGYVALTSEGGVCVPVPDGGVCPQGYIALTTEGGICVPAPDGGSCPTGYVALTSEGGVCLPVPMAASAPRDTKRIHQRRGLVPADTEGRHAAPTGSSTPWRARARAAFPRPRTASARRAFTSTRPAKGAAASDLLAGRGAEADPVPSPRSAGRG